LAGRFTLKISLWFFKPTNARVFLWHGEAAWRDVKGVVVTAMLFAITP
jgi:hypothetical protein